MRNLKKIEKPLALLSFLCLFPAGMSAQSIVKGETLWITPAGQFFSQMPQPMHFSSSIWA